MSRPDVCAICDAPLVYAGGRPALYCSARCKYEARQFAKAARVIAVIRAAGDEREATGREVWLAGQRADARHGFAGVKARIAAVNARMRMIR